MTVMLILVILVIYTSTIGGAGGTKDRIRENGGKVNVSIEQINQ